jgi:hypothetical protein
MNAPAQIKQVRCAVNEWYETDRAQELLAQIDAAERMADHWHEWRDVAKAFTEQADDLQGDLDNLRCDAIHDAMSAYGCPYGSEEYYQIHDEVEADAPPVEQVVNDARGRSLGDEFLKWRAAV